MVDVWQNVLHPNISLYHEIGANMNKLIINWNTFTLQQPCHNAAIIKKGL
jgi:hypothetical protein